MEETNSWTYISVLLQANSLTDFLSRLNDIVDIVRSDQNVKEEYIAATQWYFLIGNAAMSLFRADSGFVTPVVLRCWCFAMPAVLAGMWIGSHIYKRIRLPLLRKVVYAYMALAGLLSIIL